MCVCDHKDGMKTKSIAHSQGWSFLLYLPHNVIIILLLLTITACQWEDDDEVVFCSKCMFVHVCVLITWLTGQCSNSIVLLFICTLFDVCSPVIM